MEVEVEQEVVVEVSSDKSEATQIVKTSTSESENVAYDDMTTNSVPMTADFKSDNKILPPSKKRDKKGSKLDDYKVDIRKPGKRV